MFNRYKNIKNAKSTTSLKGGKSITNLKDSSRSITNLRDSSRSMSNLRERVRREDVSNSVNDLKSTESLAKEEDGMNPLSKKKSKSKKKLTASKNSINNINTSHEIESSLMDMAGHGGNLNKPGAEKIDMDNLWIYGYSIANLQRFYAPQYDAEKQLKKKTAFSHKYPIPNPNPWK